MKSVPYYTISCLALLALSACGAKDIASPGEGTLVGGTATATPTPTATATSGTVTAAASCPTRLTDAGTISNSNGSYRVCQLPSTIDSDLALAKMTGVIYSLSGRVNVGTDKGGSSTGNNVTLTIDPGVVVFGSNGLDYLVVNRGNRINAVGTASSPIIFTSRANVLGTATDTSSGQWGGVVLLGRAPISDCLTGESAGGFASCERILEGTSDVRFGGATAADNSGTMQYVQIRYSGFELSAGSELQGLTLGGTGSGTTLSHIQVHNSSDDGIEVFGGRTNMKNLVITGAEDDSLDTDVGYKGFVQYLIAVQRSTGDRLLEIDSANSNVNYTPRQNVRLANFTLVGNGNTVPAVTLHGGADYSLFNGVITGKTNCLDIDGAATVQAADSTLDEAGAPVFHSVHLSCTTSFVNDTDVTATDIQTLFNAGTNNTAGGTSTLASVFVNGANETAVAAYSLLTSISSYFTSTAYIGAVRNSSDTWYRGWTCDSSFASFGSGSACTSLPA